MLSILFSPSIIQTTCSLIFLSQHSVKHYRGSAHKTNGDSLPCLRCYYRTQSGETLSRNFLAYGSRETRFITFSFRAETHPLLAISIICKQYQIIKSDTSLAKKYQKGDFIMSETNTAALAAPYTHRIGKVTFRVSSFRNPNGTKWWLRVSALLRSALNGCPLDIQRPAES